MKRYFKPLIILYVAIAFSITGYFYINPPVIPANYIYADLPPSNKPLKGNHQLISIHPEHKNYKPCLYSILGFTVGAMILYASYLIVIQRNQTIPE